MANPNPIEARLAKRRARDPGNIDDLLRTMWSCICDVDAALNEAITREEVFRGAHSMSQCVATYIELLQFGEYDGRIAQLETTVEALRHAQPGYLARAN